MRIAPVWSGVRVGAVFVWKIRVTKNPLYGFAYETKP